MKHINPQFSLLPRYLTPITSKSLDFTVIHIQYLQKQNLYLHTLWFLYAIPNYAFKKNTLSILSTINHDPPANMLLTPGDKPCL